jgi:hypothetical protein
VVEDIYLCCVYDLVEAAFASEVESVLKSTNNSELKTKQLDQLTSVIELLPFKSPQYETTIKPRLEKKITQAKAEL